MKAIVWFSNVYFTLFYAWTLLFIASALYAVARRYFYEDPTYPGAAPTILLIVALLPLPFYVGVISVAKWKLKQGYLTKKFIGLVLFPIANFLKLLPYLTRQKTWVKLVAFQLLTLCCSITGYATFGLIYEIAASRSVIRVWDWVLVLFIYGPGILFLLTSTLYWKYYVLSQNPVFQLMLLHPEGRRVAKGG